MFTKEEIKAMCERADRERRAESSIEEPQASRAWYLSLAGILVWLVAVLVWGSLLGCAESGTKRLAEEIAKAQHLARASEKRFVDIGTAAAQVPPEIDYIQEQAKAGAGEQREILGAGDAMAKALPGVHDNESALDKIWHIVKTLSAWGIAAVALFLLLTTTAGHLVLGFLGGLFNRAGLLLPKDLKTRAKRDAEKVESGAADAHDHATVTAAREHAAYNAAYLKAQRAIRQRKGGAA